MQVNLHVKTDKQKEALAHVQLCGLHMSKRRAIAATAVTWRENQPDDIIRDGGCV